MIDLTDSVNAFFTTIVLKPGFHPNAIACVGKQSIMVATASTEYPIGCKQQPIGSSVEAVATMIDCFPTQAIAFGCKPGLSVFVFNRHDRKLEAEHSIECITHASRAVRRRLVERRHIAATRRRTAVSSRLFALC